MIAEKYGIFPIVGYWLSCDVGEYSGHSGADFGYHAAEDEHAPVWAWKSGVVVNSVFDGSRARGNVITIRHDYGNGTYQYTNYLHLKDREKISGDEVKRGDEIGLRGGTKDGKSYYGTHLHFTISNITTSKLEGAGATQWAANNPLYVIGNVYKDPTKKYFFWCNNGGSNDKTPLGNYRDLRDIKLIPCEPVDRNTEVHQYRVKDPYIRLRLGHSLKAESIGNIQVGIYNVHEVVEEDGYKWMGLDNGYWSAFIEGDCEDLPAESDKEKIKKLEAENKELKAKVELKDKAINDADKALQTGK